MYQSFPQGFYREQSDAMPIARPPETRDIGALPQTGGGMGGLLHIFDKLSMDDLILIGLIILLLTEGSEEWLLIGLLAFILMQ